MALGNSPAGATLGGTLTATATDGVATFSGLTLTAAASGYTLDAPAAASAGDHQRDHRDARGRLASGDHDTAPGQRDRGWQLRPSGVDRGPIRQRRDIPPVTS